MAKKPSYLIEYIDKYKRWKETDRPDDENDSSGDEKYVPLFYHICPALGFILSRYHTSFCVIDRDITVHPVTDHSSTLHSVLSPGHTAQR